MQQKLTQIIPRKNKEFAGQERSEKLAISILLFQSAIDFPETDL